VELPRGLLRGQSQTLDPETVQTLRALVGAGDPEPSLTLQPVIHQRRAKPSNEYRPLPQSQQAWSGTHAEEARELRAFDRIRDDGPLRPSGKRNNAKRKKKRGNAQTAGQQPGGRQNPARRGKNRSAGQTQIGVYQPSARSLDQKHAEGRLWFAGDERPSRKGQGRNKSEGMHQNRHPFQNEGSQPGKRSQRRDRSHGGGNYAADFAAHGQRPFRQDQAPPRDDIGNRLHPEGRRGGRRR
jgi:23S rRNA pseudouridine2605 synthase